MYQSSKTQIGSGKANSAIKQRNSLIQKDQAKNNLISITTPIDSKMISDHDDLFESAQNSN